MEKVSNIEVWKSVAGFDGAYEASNMGRIRSVTMVRVRKNRWGGLSQFKSSGTVRRLQNGTGGYLMLTLCGTSKLAHRVIAKTFIPNPHNLPEVNHIDGNKKNNIVSNLEWVSREQNIRHGFATGLIKSSLGTSVKVVIKKGEETHEFNTQKEAAEFIGCSARWVGDAKIHKYKCKGWEVFGVTRKRHMVAVWHKNRNQNRKNKKNEPVAL